MGTALAVLAACGTPPAPSPGPDPSTSAPSGRTTTPLPSTSATPSTSSTPSAGPTSTACQRRAASMSTAEQVGQLFMMGIGSTGLAGSEASTLRRYRIGSVILLGNSTAGVEGIKTVTDDVRSSARQPTGVTVLLAADQEGGLVQRLQGDGFDTIASARAQAQQSDATLRRDATTWARQLKRAGIDADLAPVADVVPTDLERVNQPIGVLRRGFGPKPTVVAAKVTAVVTGMDAAGVATAVKHYPGLGRVRGNTDYQTRVVDASTTRGDDDQRGFAAGVEAGTDMVMISSAVYTKIDASQPAAFSRVVIGQMVRGDLAFSGVVISDDLAAKAVSSVSPGDRALRFLRAGGDLVIVGDPGLAGAMVDAVVARVSSDDAFAQQVSDKAARVLTMKARRGLAKC